LNPLTVFKLIRPHLKLAFSWRFVVATLLLLVSVAWLAVCSLQQFEFLGFNFSSLPICIYALVLLVFLLAVFFALGKTPVEYKLINQLRLAIADLKHEKAEQLLTKKIGLDFWFTLPTSKIHFAMQKASIYKEQGRVVDTYNIIQHVRQLPLLPKEKIEVQLILMQLYYAAGNFKACQQKTNKLQDLKLTLKQQLSVSLIQCELDMLEGKYQQAKDRLEELYATPKLSVNAKVAILHTLAVAETHLGNYEGVLTNYRQAWDLQKKQKNNFAQAERTAENLMLSYAKQGELTKIQPILKQLEALASNTSQVQQLALHNIKINLARQLNDRKALVQVYAQAEHNLLPLLKDEQRLMYIVFGLRMHFNDNVDFEKAVQDVQNAMLIKPAISTLNNLRAIKEISGILHQAIQKFGPQPGLMTFLSWLLFEFKRLEPELDSLQDQTPLNLPGLKAELISLKVDGLKNTMFLMRAQPNKVLFDKMFELLQEKKNLWQGMNNPLAQLETLVIILDEYQAYRNQTASPQFEADFKPLALNALEEAEQLVNDNPKHLAYSDKLIGLAYICYQLNIKKAQAKQWLEIFENSKQSLNHNAAWLRQHYQETKAWVSTT